MWTGSSGKASETARLSAVAADRFRISAELSNGVWLALRTCLEGRRRKALCSDGRQPGQTQVSRGGACQRRVWLPHRKCVEGLPAGESLGHEWGHLVGASAEGAALGGERRIGLEIAVFISRGDKGCCSKRSSGELLDWLEGEQLHVQ